MAKVSRNTEREMLSCPSVCVEGTHLFSKLQDSFTCAFPRFSTSVHCTQRFSASGASLAHWFSRKNLVEKDGSFFHPLWIKIADEGAVEHESGVWTSMGYCRWEHGRGDKRSKKDLERGAMGKGALPISVAVKEGTTTATCGDTAGLVLPKCKRQVRVSSVPSFLPIWKARITLSDLAPHLLHRLVLLQAKPSEQDHTMKVHGNSDPPLVVSWSQ